MILNKGENEVSLSFDNPPGAKTLCMDGIHSLFQSITSSVQLLSCVQLCDPMECSMPGFPAHHQLLVLAQTHVHPWVDGCHPTISHSVIPLSSCLHSFPAPGSFPMSHFFASGGQIIGVSVSASILPVNTENWFSLGLTGLIFLKSKGLSRVFSDTTV